MNSLQQNASYDIEPFVNRIDILFHELELSIKWGRPSTLFAVYTSDYVRAEAEAALAGRISELGHQVFRVQLAPEGSISAGPVPAIPTERDNIVLFVDSPSVANRELELAEIMAANRSRDYLSEKNLRIVFWLREGEALGLAQHAPDSWALRHRVVEFVDSPMSQEIIQCALDGAKNGACECAMAPQDVEARIKLGEALLNELPDQDQGTAVYAKLLLTLGILTWKTHDMDKALKYLTTARDISGMLDDRQLQAECLISIGRMDIERGEGSLALESFERASELVPDHENLAMELGILYSELGRHDRAIDALLKAIGYSPTDVCCWKHLGDAYLAQGRDDSALAAYQRSISLCPGSVEALVGLGRAFAAADRLEEASEAFREALTQEPDNAGACLAMSELLLRQRLAEVHPDSGSELVDEETTPPEEQILSDSQLAMQTASGCQQIADFALDQSIEVAHDDLLEIMDEEVHFSLGQYEKAESLAFPASPVAIENASLTTLSEPVRQEPVEISALPLAEAENSQDAGTWNDAGHVHLEAGRYDAAIAAYIRAIELSDGSNWSYISNLTQAYYRKGQGQETAVQGEAQGSNVALDTGQALIDEIEVSSQPEPVLQVLPEQNLVPEPAAPQTASQPEEVRAEAAFIAGVGISQLFANDQQDEINFKVRAHRPASSRKWLPKAFRAENLDLKLLADAEHEDARFGLRRQYRHRADEDDILGQVKISASDKSEFDFPGVNPVVSPIAAGALNGKMTTAQEWLEEGNRMMRSGLYDEAIDCYNSSLALAPNSGGTYSNLALAHCYKEQYSDALPLYQKSIYLLRSSKEKAISWNRLGDAYRRLNDQTSAAAAYRNAAQIYPGTNTLRTRARTALLSNATAP